MNLVPLDELAKELGVNRTTVYRLARRHNLQTFKKLGDRRTWIDRDAVAPYAEFQPKAQPGATKETTTTSTEQSTALPSVASCYVVHDGRLLMTRRRFSEGTFEWAAISGGIEPGETPEQAAVREAREEVGLTIEVSERLGDRLHPATGRHLIYIAARIVDGAPSLIDHEENVEWDWADWPTVQQRWANLKGGIFPPVLAYLEQAMAPRGTSVKKR